MTIKSMPPTPEYLNNWDRVFVKGYGFKKNRRVEKRSSHLAHNQEIEGSTPSPAITMPITEYGYKLQDTDKGFVIKPLGRKNERVNNKKRNKRLA